jgi:hypothetical protein
VPAVAAIESSMCDIWVFGSQEQIDIKTQYYYHIDKYWYNHGNFNDVIYEKPLTQYFKDKNVPIQPSNLNFELIRVF